MLYRIVNSGKNERREYLSLNRSPLFQNLPNKNFGQEQKLSYDSFLKEDLEKLFFSHFPVEFSNYNNNIWCVVKKVIYEEPKISEDEARTSSLTWSYSISLLWSFVWDCKKIQIPLGEGIISDDIKQWVEKSFKIGDFNFREKIAGEQWEVEEKKGKLKIVISFVEKQENTLIIKFHCEEEKEIPLCQLPKINPQGNFIINGHNKVVIFQSVRAPSVYLLTGDSRKGEIYCEIIPTKGPWISLNFSKKKPEVIELKFLNLGLAINVLELFKTFDISTETLNKLFNNEDLNIENYSEIKVLESADSLPKFLFTEVNSYFNFGKLGRKKFNQKSNILKQLAEKTLAEDLWDVDGKLLLVQGTILDKKNLEIIAKALAEQKLPHVSLPLSTHDLYLVKVKSLVKPGKIALVVGFGEDLSEEKTYFDLGDLVCSVSLYCNLKHGILLPEEEETKDKLENQIIRQVGDLIYNIFENKLGSFLQNINNKYLAYLSQFKKTDLAKIPNLKDFDNLLRYFFNTSALVQLQNQNNPLSELSYTQKLSVLGLGGFSSSNTTFAARNINHTYINHYDLVETPEGQRVGLVHNLTIQSRINNYGQITVPYYPVKKGIIIPEPVYLTIEEEWDQYIIHCNIKITEDNRILSQKMLARFCGDFVWVTEEKINYIDTSFYQLNSITSATIPFFNNNDAARMLMATNMQRQAVVPAPSSRGSQEPWVASGVEANIGENSPLAVHAEEGGLVEYVDSQRIVVKEKDGNKKTYDIKQLIVSNKNILNLSSPLVIKGEKIEKGQIIANGNYTKNNELALGYNLRVAYCCWDGYNFEDAIVLNKKLVKEDVLTSFFVKKHVIIRHNTKYGPEIFTPSLPYLESKKFPHLDKDGLVKIGSEVSEHDILVGKITPHPQSKEESEEEALLLSILGEKSRHFVDSSLYLPTGEKGVVYDVKRREFSKNRKELEIVEVYVAQERKISVGDKLTTRFGNKGVVAKIVPEADMPFDKEGKSFDIIFNPLSVPSRMNIGQLLETIFAEASFRLGSKLLVRPFNTPSLSVINQIVSEAKIENYGAQKLFDGRTGLPFHKDIYTGYIYTIKLNHMVADKIHARNTGSYSLIYQQPPKGRSLEGGQRVGEMENWALQAHGAAYNLMEMMGTKSDDIHKRHLVKSALVFDNRPIILQSSQNESFNLFLQYLRGIGFDLQAIDYQNKEIDFYKLFSKS